MQEETELNLIRYLAMTLFLFSTIFAQTQKLKNVSLQLSWKNQFEFAGYYMAKEKGFYKNFGLKVDIKEYEAGINSVNEVLKGKVQFAIGRSSLILDRAKGKSVLLMSAILQSSPLAFVSLKKSGIDSILDFSKKRVMVSVGNSSGVSLESMLFSSGVKLSNLKIQKPTFNINDLINSKTDIMSVYLSNEIHQLDKKGIKYKVWYPENYGFSSYDDILFTSVKEFKENPTVVMNFNKASLMGWKYAFSHVSETVDVILKKYNTQKRTRDDLLYEAKVLRNFAYYKTKKLGKIDLSRVENIYNAYRLMGMADKKIDFNNFILNDELFGKNLTVKKMVKLYEKDTVRVCINSDWMPIEFLENGKPQGISIDTLKLIGENTGLKFKFIKTRNWEESQKFLKQKKCDILPSAIKTAKREKYADFTKPYLSYKLAIVTRKGEPIVRDMQSIVDKSMARKKGSGLISKIKKLYPNIKIIETKSYKETFDFIKDKRAYFTISTIPVLLYYSNLYNYDFQITGYTDMVYRLCIAVRKDEPVLLEILDMSLKLIPKSEHKIIFEKWTRQKIIHRYDYKYLMWSIVTFVFIILFILLYVVKLKNEILKRISAETEMIRQKKLLYHQANYDELTNLPNRRLFIEKLKRFLAGAKDDEKIALLIMNIDRLKFMNDSFGFDVGNSILMNFSNIVKSVIGKNCIFARLGGDEFAVIFPEISSEKQAIELAREINNSLVEPFKINNHNLHITCCTGISIYPKDSKSIKNLLMYADIALAKAKERGKNCFELHSPNMSSSIFERAVMESSVREAIKHCEFVVYFQPQIDAISKNLIGMEALVRWKHPALGLIQPNKFIPVAEDIGMIVDIDKIVMQKAFAQFQKWRKNGFDPGMLSLNLSVKHLESEDYMRTLVKNIEEFSFDASCLELEITEGEVMKNPNESIMKLKKIHELGIKISIDDFGTGYSSLSYLKRLPIDKLKIDQSFIRNLPFDNEDASIVKAIIALSNSLGLDKIAEGIETKEQRDFLVKNDCSKIQGFYYSKPICAQDFEHKYFEKREK